ncbi:hypothetical protein GCM10025864_00970 [Luteimicrobium album]|uniref:Uncharacterized protein n=1 Tax=Luteimicrobium album TaxID=1054550 RepID=A0ABQ6HWT3_9MICO|nr:hypothetical protein [Luteimicrobium album]GMA22338.1 hypothetical protein GCM10025864_00970 [Luteimicrobium album]
MSARASESALLVALAGLPGSGKSAAAPARDQWRALAARTGARLRFVEVVCPDPALHRARLEGRRRDLPGFPEPTWADVVRLEGEVAPWTDPRLELDSRRPLDDLVAVVLADLAAPPHEEPPGP